MHFLEYVLLGGLITLILIIIDALIVIRIIKLDMKWNTILTILILIFGIIHGLSAFLYANGIIKF